MKEMLNFLLSQVSRPYKQAEFEIIFGEGVSKLVSIVLGLDNNNNHYNNIINSDYLRKYWIKYWRSWHLLLLACGVFVLLLKVSCILRYKKLFSGDLNYSFCLYI